MSGSNKFSNIKHRKGAQDARRSKIYSQISQEIAVAVEHGGIDPADNAKLRSILQKARKHNMPGASIRRALSRGTSTTPMRTAIYEARGPEGCAMLVEVRTDNTNRSTAFVRSTLNKHGATLMQTGSTAHLFRTEGRFVCNELANAEELALLLMDAGLEDFELFDGGARFTTTRDGFGAVQEALTRAGVQPTSVGRHRHDPPW